MIPSWCFEAYIIGLGHPLWMTHFAPYIHSFWSLTHSRLDTDSHELIKSFSVWWVTYFPFLRSIISAFLPPLVYSNSKLPPYPLEDFFQLAYSTNSLHTPLILFFHQTAPILSSTFISWLHTTFSLIGKYHDPLHLLDATFLYNAPRDVMCVHLPLREKRRTL